MKSRTAKLVVAAAATAVGVGGVVIAAARDTDDTGSSDQIETTTTLAAPDQTPVDLPPVTDAVAPSTTQPAVADTIPMVPSNPSSEVVDVTTPAAPGTDMSFDQVAAALPSWLLERHTPADGPYETTVVHGSALWSQIAEELAVEFEANGWTVRTDQQTPARRHMTYELHRHTADVVVAVGPSGANSTSVQLRLTASN